MKNAIRSIWLAPRAPDPPRRVWSDWALVTVLVPVAIVEGILRQDFVWRPLEVAVGVTLVSTLLWRRSHPLGMVVVAFGTTTLLSLAKLTWATPDQGLNTMAFILLLLYSLVRWGSGREVVVGLGVVAVSLVVGAIVDPDSISALETAASVVFVGLPAEVGASIRYRERVRLREMDQFKSRERELLARDLHDSVAHHVSAIAIQAQAGRTLAPTNDSAAVDALEIIEEEASRMLVEMRALVRTLREGEEPELAPQRGVADIERLAASSGDAIEVDVEMSGAFYNLGSSVDAAIYRLAQEAITNARRHARHATRIRVRVEADEDSVSLTVTDDGNAGPIGGAVSPGYGIVGMSERAKLLGGTLEAGPGRTGGWTVHAELPKIGKGK